MTFNNISLAVDIWLQLKWRLRMPEELCLASMNRVSRRNSKLILDGPRTWLRSAICRSKMRLSPWQTMTNTFGTNSRHRWKCPLTSWLLSCRILPSGKHSSDLKPILFLNNILEKELKRPTEFCSGSGQGRIWDRKQNMRLTLDPRFCNTTKTTLTSHFPCQSRTW